MSKLAIVEGATPVTPAAPRERGRLLSTAQVVDEIYGGQMSAWWVNLKFAPEFKIKQGRNNFWWEADAHAWLDSRRQVAL